VLVFKDNLPFNDFVAIPVSSKIQILHKDEIEIGPEHFIQGSIPKRSKLMLRKTFVVSKDVILKKYGTLDNTMLNQCQDSFCNYFDC
jgi:mRNA interferase MazF